jgi:hypothetical protein
LNVQMDIGMLVMAGCGTFAVKGAPGYHQALRNREVAGIPHQDIPTHNQVCIVCVSLDLFYEILIPAPVSSSPLPEGLVFRPSEPTPGLGSCPGRGVGEVQDPGGGCDPLSVHQGQATQGCVGLQLCCLEPATGPQQSLQLPGTPVPQDVDLRTTDPGRLHLWRQVG